MSAMALSPDLLMPWGRALLILSFALCLIRSMRSTFDLELSFERLVVGFLALTFFKGGASILLSMANELSQFISKLGNEDDLKALVLEAFRKANGESIPGGGGGTNIPSVLEQAWRTGIWGVMTTLVDWVFLVASFLIESAREVFWTLLVFLFPISCGVYPIFPSMLSNSILYAIELALWFPFLSAVEIVTGTVAKKYMAETGSWGLYVVAVELLAIFLIFLIPSLTHQFLSGALSADMGSQSSLMRSPGKLLKFAKTWGQV